MTAILAIVSEKGGAGKTTLKRGTGHNPIVDTVLTMIAQGRFAERENLVSLSRQATVKRRINRKRIWAVVLGTGFSRVVTRPDIKLRRHPMPLRFQRRARIAQGISLNLNKRSVSASFGRRGAHFTIGPKGRRTTIGLPGTGFFYTIYQRAQPGMILIILIAALLLLGIVFRLLT
jgi:hypothetical protein